MNQYFVKIVDAIEENGNIAKEDREIYLFALNTVFLYAVNIISSMVIGVVLGMFWYCFVFLSALIVLRQEAGGYHALDWKKCYFLSCAIIIVTLLWLKIQFQYQAYFTMGLAMISAVCIFVCAPLESENKPLEMYEKKIMKRRTQIIVSIEMILGLSLMPFHKTFACAVLCAVIWCGSSYAAWFVEKIKFSGGNPNGK